MATDSANRGAGAWTPVRQSADGSGTNSHILRIPLRLDGQLRRQQTLRLVLRDVRAIHNIRNELRTERQREIAAIDVAGFFLIDNEQVVALLGNGDIRVLAQLDVAL